jgi:hypothetical protein
MHATKAVMTMGLSDFMQTNTYLTRRAAQLWLAARVGAWLCVLPLRWRARGLTTVLRQIGPASSRRTPSTEIESIARVVRRVAGLGMFRLRIFPRPCLREALALFHVLSRAGHPVEFCVGVLKAGDDLLAHSWVSVHGSPINPADRNGGFRVLYSYPDRRTGILLDGRQSCLPPILEKAPIQ